MDNMENKKIEYPKDLEMYFNKDVSISFAELEQNEKNMKVAQIMDRSMMYEIKDLQDPLYVSELGGGAHPDRYDKLFSRLLKEPIGKID